MHVCVIIFLFYSQQCWAIDILMVLWIFWSKPFRGIYNLDENNQKFNWQNLVPLFRHKHFTFYKFPRPLTVWLIGALECYKVKLCLTDVHLKELQNINYCKLICSFQNLTKQPSGSLPGLCRRKGGKNEKSSRLESQEKKSVSCVAVSDCVT